MSFQDVFSPSELSQVIGGNGAVHTIPTQNLSGYSVINRSGATIYMYDDNGRTINIIHPFYYLSGTVEAPNKQIQFKVFSTDPVIQSQDYSSNTWFIRCEFTYDPQIAIMAPIGICIIGAGGGGGTGIPSITWNGTTLTGAQTVNPGSGIGISVAGSTVTISNTGVLSEQWGATTLTGAIQLIAGTNVSFSISGQQVTINATAGGGGVSSVNGLAGAITIAAGNGITVNTSSPNITITNTWGTFPLTTEGDLVYYHSGASTRLGIGSAYQELQVNSAGTDPVWAASPTSTLTTTGDLLYASAANTLARLGIGATSQILSVVAGLPAWVNQSANLTAGNGISLAGTTNVTITNTWGAYPLTTTGDIVYANAATTNTRLGIGATSQILSVVGGIPAWVNQSANLTAGTGISLAGTTNVTITNTGVTSIQTGSGGTVRTGALIAGGVNDAATYYVNEMLNGSKNSWQIDSNAHLLTTCSASNGPPTFSNLPTSFTASAAVGSTDSAGLVTVTNGSASNWTTAGRLLTITFAHAFSSIPVIVCAVNGGTMAPSAGLIITVWNATANGFDVYGNFSGVVSLATTKTIILAWEVVGINVGSD